jgi:predicted DNA-binding transcriptional regulator AlpA
MKRSSLIELPKDHRVISEPDAAAYCGLSLVHFRRLRREERGPKHVRLTEKRIGYRLKDVLAWIDERIC